jgi:hypothetical protein
MSEVTHRSFGIPPSVRRKEFSEKEPTKMLVFCTSGILVAHRTPARGEGGSVNALSTPLLSPVEHPPGNYFTLAVTPVGMALNLNSLAIHVMAKRNKSLRNSHVTSRTVRHMISQSRSTRVRKYFSTTTCRSVDE